MAARIDKAKIDTILYSRMVIIDGELLRRHENYPVLYNERWFVTKQKVGDFFS